MDIEYDSETDAAFIWVGMRPDSPVIKGELWPDELKGHIGLLFDGENRLLGVEVLFASAYLPEDVLKEHTRPDAVPKAATNQS